MSTKRDSANSAPAAPEGAPTGQRIPESEWKWYGESGHLIVGFDCRFHLATVIGDYMISTVGKYWPDSRVRQIMAECRGVVVTGRGEQWDANYRRQMPNGGYDTIGCDRLYETMVFKTGKTCECGCGMPTIVPTELDFAGYNDADAAREGHMQMCAKWAAGKPESNDEN